MAQFSVKYCPNKWQVFYEISCTSPSTTARRSCCNHQHAGLQEKLFWNIKNWALPNSFLKKKIASETYAKTYMAWWTRDVQLERHRRRWCSNSATKDVNMRTRDGSLVAYLLRTPFIDMFCIQVLDLENSLEEDFVNFQTSCCVFPQRWKLTVASRNKNRAVPRMVKL